MKSTQHGTWEAEFDEKIAYHYPRGWWGSEDEIRETDIKDFIRALVLSTEERMKKEYEQKIKELENELAPYKAREHIQSVNRAFSGGGSNPFNEKGKHE